MPQASPILTSFNGGELSPRMHGRVDQAIYQISSAEMLNFVPTIEGPAMKRTGFIYIRPASSSSIWLSAFIFSVSQTYVLEWGAGKLRFYTNGGRIESGPTTPYEVTVPYTAAEAPFVSQQQSYDRLYLAHSSYAPASLLRTGGGTFSYGALVLKDGPFADRNKDESITVTADATTGTITITASSPIFLPGHVGGAFMVEAMGFGDVKAWAPGMDSVVVGTKARSDGKVYQATAILNYTGSVQPTHTRGEEWDGIGGTDTAGHGPYGAKWKYLYDSFGVGVITAVGGGGTTATVNVTRRLADTLTGSQPSFRWYLPALSSATGWPKIVLLAFGRLIFFTDFEMICSVVGDFGGGTVNMSPLSDSGLFTPDQAFRRRLAISNPILWAREDRDVILIGTADGTYAIRKTNSSEIFSSDNVECIRQSHRGVSTCPPTQTDNSTIFVQLGGRKLREADYSLDRDRYVAPNINVWQRHILKGGAKQLAFQGEPEELLWAVRGDGQLALHPHVPEQEVRGFARAQHADGPVLSACVIPALDGKDQLWVIVDGVGGRSVQLQAPSWEEGESALEDAFYVDSGATYAGPPASTITGLTHLAGREIAILANGSVQPLQTVSAGGTIAVPSGTTKAQCGLPFTARLTWLRPEVRDGAGGTIQGKRKRLVNLFLRLLETAGVKIDGGAGKVDELIRRPAGTPMDEAAPPFTGDTDTPVGGSWNREGQATIISDEPVPCMIVAAGPRIELGDK